MYRNYRNCKFKINYNNVFLYDKETHKYWLFAVKIYCVHLHGLDIRDTYMYTNSIITTVFRAQNKSYHMTYAVKTVENLFTCCGHER